MQPKPTTTSVAYMPALLPDELIYSLMARLVACNALGDPRIYLKLLFGTTNIIPSIDLPTSLASLHHTLGLLSPFDSVDGIIDAGTIYPYHRPFLTVERHQAVRQILQHGGARASKHCWDVYQTGSVLVLHSSSVRLVSRKSSLTMGSLTGEECISSQAFLPVPLTPVT